MACQTPAGDLARRAGPALLTDSRTPFSPQPSVGHRPDPARRRGPPGGRPVAHGRAEARVAQPGGVHQGPHRLRSHPQPGIHAGPLHGRPAHRVDVGEPGTGAGSHQPGEGLLVHRRRRPEGGSARGRPDAGLRCRRDPGRRARPHRRLPAHQDRSRPADDRRRGHDLAQPVREPGQPGNPLPPDGTGDPGTTARRRRRLPRHVDGRDPRRHRAVLQGPPPQRAGGGGRRPRLPRLRCRPRPAPPERRGVESVRPSSCARATTTTSSS